MRADDPRPHVRVPFRDEAKRAWRWLNRQAPRMRLAMAALALAALAGAGYAVSSSSSATPEGQTIWLYDGQSLAGEDSQRILQALAVAKIPASLGPRGQIAVPAERRADALTILAKNKLGPQTLSAIQDEFEARSPFAPPMDPAERVERTRELESQVVISRFEGISSAYVRINRGAGRSGSTRGGKMAVLVVLELREDGHLPPRSLEAIQNLIRTNEPDLPPDALTVLDKTGRAFLAVGKPEVGAAMMAQIREEDLTRRIKERLVNWIDGVEVFVRIEQTVAHSAAPAPSPPAVVLNAPAEVSDPSESATHEAASSSAKAKVLVQVPISYYLRGYEKMHREAPNLDELRSYGAKVEDTIRSTIDNLASPGEVAEVKVVRIDDPGPVPPPASTLVSEPSRIPSWAIPAGIAGAVGFAAALLLGTRWLVARRPASAPAASIPRAHFEVGDDAGPSGRVRELVRRDPAAAAGVLHRWIGQGGHGS